MYVCSSAEQVCHVSIGNFPVVPTVLHQFVLTNKAKAAEALNESQGEGLNVQINVLHLP
jgi:hypothetical protein